MVVGDQCVMTGIYIQVYLYIKTRAIAGQKISANFVDFPSGPQPKDRKKIGNQPIRPRSKTMYVESE